MAWEGWLLYGVVVFWLVPGAIWRPAALALLLSWFAGELAWEELHIYVPLKLYIAADACVIASVLARQRGATDWLILAIFPIEWVCYFTPMPERQQWFWLYWLVLMQFILAGPWVQVQRAIPWPTHGPRKPIDFRRFR